MAAAPSICNDVDVIQICPSDNSFQINLIYTSSYESSTDLWWTSPTGNNSNLISDLPTLGDQFLYSVSKKVTISPDLSIFGEYALMQSNFNYTINSEPTANVLAQYRDIHNCGTAVHIGLDFDKKIENFHAVLNAQYKQFNWEINNNDCCTKKPFKYVENNFKCNHTDDSKKKYYIQFYKDLLDKESKFKNDTISDSCH